MTVKGSNHLENIMSTLANLAVGLVALLHCYFLVLEMFFWDKPLGLRTFRLTPEFAQASKVIAANQGLYNGFLAAGLFWGMWLGTSGDAIKIFFLCCVIVAGLYGAYSVGKKILWVQVVPGLIALSLILIL
jgi:putative membrane protein